MVKRNIRLKKRGKSNRRIKPVYLVIAEGRNKTETQYLSHFQEQGKYYCIHFVKAGNNTDAESLYKTLVAKWNELGLSEKNGDRGFIILDIDNDPLKSDKVTYLMHSNENQAISFVVSNPTFEVWLLSHFKYTTKFFADGNAVISELRKNIPDYEKNKDVFSICEDKISDALKNADRLSDYYEDAAWPSVDCNPRTDMGELIKILEP